MILTIKNADEADNGTYTCEATKDGRTAKAEFEVDVKMPKKGVTITPDVTEVTCKQGDKKPCVIKFTVASDIGVREYFLNNSTVYNVIR